MLNIDKGAINEVVYEDPDSLQLQAYLPNNGGDIDLEECPVSDDPSDIKLVDCPVSMDKKNFKGQDIKPCACTKIIGLCEYRYRSNQWA